MSNQITLETLKNFYPNNHFVANSIDHNLQLYLKHVSAKAICKKNIVKFDMRKDYWNYLERVVLIKYVSDVFYKKHLDPKKIRIFLKT